MVGGIQSLDVYETLHSLYMKRCSLAVYETPVYETLVTLGSLPITYLSTFTVTVLGDQAMSQECHPSCTMFRTQHDSYPNHKGYNFCILFTSFVKTSYPVYDTRLTS